MKRTAFPRLCLVLAAGLASGPAVAQGSIARCFPNGAQRGTTVSLDLSGEGIPDSGTLLVEGEGVTAQGPFAKGKGTIVVASDAAPGVRRLRLAGPAGVTTPRPFAIGVLPEIREKEPNQDLSQAQLLDRLPVVINGELTSRPDIDTFRITLKRGECVAVAGESRALGAPTNLVVRIRDLQNRELLVQMDSRTRDPLLGFTAAADGDYLIELSEVLNNYSNLDSAYVYRVTVTLGPWIDRLHPASVQPGVASAVEAHGWNLGGRPGAGSVREALTLPASVSGPARVTLAGMPLPVSVGTAPYPHVTEEAAGTAPLTPPVVCCGTLTRPGEADTYRFQARAGQEFHFRADARDLGSAADLVLRLKDAAGKTLSTVDDASRDRDPELSWTAPADGEYSLTVRDVAGISRGGPDFFYRLIIAPPEPALSASVKDASYTLKPGGKVEIPVTVMATRLTGNLSLRVEGLPAGVTAAAPPIGRPAGRRPAATVTLTAAADAPAFAGLFRIVALHEGMPELRVEAAASWELAKDRSGTLATGSTSQLGLAVLAGKTP